MIAEVDSRAVDLNLADERRTLGGMHAEPKGTDSRSACRVGSGMHLKTLGGLVLQGSRLRRPKPLLVLTYLALEGAQHRHALAELFWPEAVDARDSLGTTLRRLRDVLGGLIDVKEDRVATTVRCDVDAFEEAVRRGEPSDVVRAYGGTFLEGLSVPVGGELEEWIWATRERLAGLARKGYLMQARRSLDDGDTAEAARLGEAAWTLPHAPTLDQQGLEALAWLLRSSHSPRHLDVDREALLLAPGRGARAPVVGASDAFALAVPATAFIGRGRELAEIAAVLRRPQGRLVTLLGPGGAGKSRLAMEAVRWLVQEGAPVDDAFLVALEAVPSAGLIGDAVVAAMGLVASTELSAEQHVIRAIGTRSVLLVLDNMEHLLDGRGFVAELVRSCPSVRVVVTSRVALNLVDEHRIAVDGLPVESDGADDGAIDLLWDRMRQVGSPRAGAADARRVCRVLDGSPLAIELAAAMTRTVPLRTLHGHLVADLGVLVNRDPTAPERHRSLHAVLDVSWRLLDARAQDGLVRLAVFHGGFSARDAAAVADVDRGLLAALVDASLLRVLPTGRYQRHPLIGQYLGAKLASAPHVERDLRQRHADYFLDEVRARDHAMLGADAATAASWLETSLANVHAAWSWAVEKGDAARLAGAAWTLGHFAEMRGRFKDVGVMFDEVAANVGRLRGLDGSAHALGCVLASRAFGLSRAGRYPAALEQGLEALNVLGGVEQPAGTWGAWAARQGMAMSLAALGRLEEGLALVRENIDACRGVRDHGVDDARWRRTLDVMEGTSHETLAMVAIQGGAFEFALEHLDEALALLTPHGAYGLGYVYWSLAQAYLGIGAVDTADAHLQEGLRFVEATGFRNQLGRILTEVARVHLHRGDAAAAESACDRAIALAVESGDSALEASARAAYGRAAWCAERTDDARARFRASIAVARETACYPAAMEALDGLATLAASEGREGEAVRLYAYLSGSPHSTAALVAAAEAGLAALAQSLDPGTYERHYRLGASASPERVFAAA